jgi:SAM-dependent methyltransferase
LSARVMVPMVLELVQPKSVIDLGCGTGEWLSVFQENGVEDIWGVDGPYVNKKSLKIPQDRFVLANLEQPLPINRSFDLVMSLEVAEHLRHRSAASFVENLTKLGDVVLFSAAIPLQGGVQHINEQWPEYWVKRFNDKGYVVTDPLRGKVWDDDRVEFWYKQNTFMFIARDQLRNYPLLEKAFENSDAYPLSVVHPRLFLERNEELKQTRERTLKGIARRFLPYGIYRLVRGAYRLVRKTD